MEDFTEACIKQIKSIPYGKVATYGQIAKLAGNPRGARQVSRLLHTMSEKHNLPWHRIINSQGRISLTPPERQAERLIAEGVEVTHRDKVDLNTFQWVPDDDMEELWMQG